VARCPLARLVTTSPDLSEANKALPPALRAGCVAGSLALLAVGYLRFYRPWQLRWGATEEEAGRAMPGDGVVQRPTFDATRAVSIAAPPECVFPWLVQIGVGRAGWYSYDLLDNLGRPSAEVILQEHQHLDIGDVVPMSPDGLQGMKVLGFRANDCTALERCRAVAVPFRPSGMCADRAAGVAVAERLLHL
jgi:hypothetical protein